MKGEGEEGRERERKRGREGLREGERERKRERLDREREKVHQFAQLQVHHGNGSPGEIQYMLLYG